MYTEDEIMVSICCITYNHEKYIADALEGFLMQETDFKFEILIHDDASTDRTAEIIRSYEQKYPEIIKPIYQTENQYSKGIKPSTLLYKQSKSKYIALCEGDDYWIDPHKLQKQVEEMEKYPECDMSFHASMIIYVDDDKKKYYNTYLKSGNIVISPEKMMTKGASYCPTASMMFRKSFISDLPEWFKKVPTADFFLQLLGSARGGAIYIDKPMSVYRRGVKGAWTESYNNDFEFLLKHVNKTIEYLKQLNSELRYKYDKEIQIQISKYMSLGAYRLLLEKRYDEFEIYVTKSWSHCPWVSKEQMIMYYFKKIPTLILFLDKMKREIRKVNSEAI